MRRSLILTSVTLFTIFCLQLVLAFSALAESRKVIIGYADNPDKRDEDDIRARGGRVKYRYFIVPAIAAELEEAEIDKIKKNPRVEYVEPDYVVHAVETPNDPEYGRLWGLSKIRAPEAWDIETGNSGVVIAVIDTGVAHNHPDLANNMWTNPGETPNDGIDNDGNGYIDDYYGWDFYNDDNDPMDDHSHGSHCAGTIAAVGNNGIGVVGVNWAARIMAMKFIGASGSGPTSGAIASIEYATMMKGNGVPVIATSNSWGGGGYSTTLETAIANSSSAGILFVAAAGNNSIDNDVQPFYPASYSVENVISVAATDANDNLASFSSYGSTSVDLAAPGVSIYSTVPGGYSYKSGTSMATPHVAGVAGLIKAQFPDIALRDIKDRILSSVDPVTGLSGKVLTGGRLNARNALDGGISRPDPPTGLVATAANQQVSLDWNDNTEPELTGYNVYRSTTSGGGYICIATGVTASAYTDTGLNGATAYYYVITAVCNSVSESDYSNEASAITPPIAPTGLVATGGDTQVSLDWDDNNGPELAGYNIYRSITQGGPYTQIAASVPQSNYTDMAVENGTTYYYVVEAVDTSGRQSDYSNEASATPAEATSKTLYIVDNVLVRYSDDNWYQIASGSYADFQFESFTVPDGKAMTSVIIYVEHREDGGFKGNVEWIAKDISKTDVPLHTEDQLDSWDVTSIVNTPDLANLWLRIKNNSTKLKKTNIDCIYAQVEWCIPDGMPPAQVTGLSVTTTGSSTLSLNWNDNTETDLHHYNVYRSTTPGAPYDLIASPVDSSYLDTGLAPSTTYYYVVSGVDESGNEGPTSVEVSGKTGAIEGGIMYAQSITFSSKVAGPNIFLYTDVEVVDGSTTPLADVLVDITIENDSGGPWNFTGNTGPDGVARFTLSKVSPGQYSATVNSLTLSGYTWDRSKGIESSTCDLLSNGTVVQGSALVTAQSAFQLLQNVPNPFNPETWIPYAVQRPGNVIIRIYDVTGRLVRTLDLGQKAAGAYVSKEKAAYWDGSNESGEKVSSGIYFYTMEAGSFRQTKRMLITR